MKRVRDERPLRAVPNLVWALLALALAAQIGWSSTRPAPRASADDLPWPPEAAVLRVAALGEPIALGKTLMLWLQAFDYRATNKMPFRELDYARVEAWLERILQLDPTGQYPLMAASRLYAEVNDPPRQRRMLEFIHARYLEDPNRRWPWLAHATLVAKHSLKDLELARRFARSLQQHTTAADIPLWARQMEPFILEDMNELEAARIMIGGLIESGQVRDPRDAALLAERLKRLEARLAEQKSGATAR